MTGPVDAITEGAAPAGKGAGAKASSKSTPSGTGTPWRHITLTDLIAASLIHPPLNLTKQYRGAQVSGRVEADGQVSFQGKRYSSLSIAAAMARVSVAGPFEGREYPSTNGWTFWQFRDADGQLREVDVLRRRLFEQEGG